MSSKARSRAPQTTAVGDARGSQSASANIAIDQVSTKGWATKSTGPDDAPGKGPDETDRQDAFKSAFDYMPHDYGADDAVANESFRDLISTQAHWGPDKLMGQREWDVSAADLARHERRRLFGRYR